MILNYLAKQKSKQNFVQMKQKSGEFRYEPIREPKGIGILLLIIAKQKVNEQNSSLEKKVVLCHLKDKTILLFYLCRQLS